MSNMADVIIIDLVDDDHEQQVADMYRGKLSVFPPILNPPFSYLFLSGEMQLGPLPSELHQPVIMNGQNGGTICHFSQGYLARPTNPMTHNLRSMSSNARAAFFSIGAQHQNSFTPKPFIEEEESLEVLLFNINQRYSHLLEKYQRLSKAAKVGKMISFFISFMD